MGTLEIVLLTAAVVVIDLIILKEYLRLEEELVRTKQLNEPSPAELGSMAQEIVAPLPEQLGEASIVFQEPEAKAKTDVERQNEALKAKEAVVEESKRQMHIKELDALGAKIDDILESIRSIKHGVVQA